MTNNQTKSRVTRGKILDAAAHAFRQSGYAATTLAEIAKSANIKTGSLYYHFDSKQQILEEVLDLGIQGVHDAVLDSQNNLPITASTQQRIRAAVEAHLKMLLKRGDYTAANIQIIGGIPDDIWQRQFKRRKAYASLWRNILNQARERGDIRADIDLALFRMLLMGALNWSLEWYKPGKKSIQVVTEQICLMLFEGLRPVSSLEESLAGRPNRI